MKTVFCFFTFFLILVGFNTANSQSLSVFNVDASAFPYITGNFFAFDANGKQITNLSNSDISITENGQPRTVTYVSCPQPKPMQALSSVLVIDVSGSMRSGGLDMAKAAANAWINMLPLDKSECAITSFSDLNYLNQDFTTDKTKLVYAIDNLAVVDGTNYDAAMINSMAGGVLIAKTGKLKRIVVFLSDGGPNFTPQTDLIISEALANNITIYCVTIRMPAPQCMKEFASQTGGMCFENITTPQEAEECYRNIFRIAQGSDPCGIKWTSGIFCEGGTSNVEIKLIKHNLICNTKFYIPSKAVPKLDFSPPSVKFLRTEVGIPRDTTISITAINADFNITNITSSNPAYSIAPKSFILSAGESKDLTLSYMPPDSYYTFTKFDFENDLCLTKYTSNARLKLLKPSKKILKLIHPNGGQEFAVGSDTVITWDGILAEDFVRLEYSIDNGATWILISDSASGLKHNWHIPKTPSNKCLVRIIALPNFNDIIICNQIWMRRNLDEEYYRNGDEIPEVTNRNDWNGLTTGAWCFYDFDPTMGPIYGKLYNWYAVDDPRGLAPDGYHIASDSEWVEVEDCLDGSFLAGNKLKEAGTAHWQDPNKGATNESGFTALPGGFTNGYIREYGFWWTATDYPRYPGIEAGEAWSRGMQYGNPSVGRNAYTKGLGLSVRCVSDFPPSACQSDTSDAVFAIIATAPSTIDIDMKKCLVGSIKDSSINNFMSNIGTLKFRVDSIYFTGADATAFQLASGFPKYDLLPAESKAAEINFKPDRVGIHNANINIITQADTIVKNIIGEGVAPKLEVISKLLDFGQVEVGRERVFQDTVLVKNISGSPVDITNVVQLGPDKTQFDVLSGGGAFTLQPNEYRRLTVRFKPISVGRTSGQLGFEYEGIGSPTIVQLFGNGIGGLFVTINNDSAYAGQVRRLKLVMTDNKPENIAQIAPSFEATLRFQKTILTPIKKSERTIINDSIYLKIKGTFGTSLELAQIPVIAGLGNVEETTIDIVDFSLMDNSGNKVDMEVGKTPGLFKLLSICREGGTRLFNPTGKVEIMRINPNPASDDIEINVNLIEDGATSLSVFNSNGVKIKEFNISDETGLKTIQLDIRDYNNGLYFIQLQTPTVLENQKLMIIK